MLDAQRVKELALSMGADAVSIGSIDRWEGAPIQMDPRQIMPEAKSVIAMAFRVMRGSLRGVEEGTFFSNYSSMGYGGITYLYMPMTVINLAKAIEDEGYEAIPYGHQSDWRAIDGVGKLRKNYSKAVEPGRANPDVMVQLRIASYLAGLGEIGFSKMLLTPQFGPRQRVGIMITEMELEPDPIMAPGTLCNRCMACVRACPAGALSETETVKVKLGGYDVEWTDIDVKLCDETFTGGVRVPKGEKGYYKPGSDQFKPAWFSPFYKKPRNLYNTGQAICGSRGCTRACMISMEARGVIGNKFHQPFRRRKTWSIDWSDYDPSKEARPIGDPLYTHAETEKKETD
ncbi:MAG: epoxyqueuosine reductase [Clostridiales bacterium]|nr:epoxyqueuosine reductase [Clostridiales bacterium]